MIAKSLWHTDTKTSVLRQQEITKSLKSKILHTDFSLVSTGTERLIATGGVPPEMYDKMKVPHQKGNFDFPIQYGYSLIASNGELSYHLMHPHQDIVQVKQKDLYTLSPAIPKHRATLISNIETVLNGIWDADLKETDVIAVCGFGNIGALLSMTLKTQFNREVSVIELNDWRCQKAESLGLKVDRGGVQEYDVIFHTSATQGGLQYCISHLQEEGKVIEMSWYGNKSISLNLGANFHYKRLKIIASQVSNIPLKMRPDMTYAKRKKMSEDVLKHADFDLLISDFVDFENSPVFFKDVRNGNLENGLIWIIKY